MKDFEKNNQNHQSDNQQRQSGMKGQQSGHMDRGEQGGISGDDKSSHNSKNDHLNKDLDSDLNRQGHTGGRQSGDDDLHRQGEYRERDMSRDANDLDNEDADALNRDPFNRKDDL